MVSSAGESGFLAAALHNRILLFFVATQCLCAPHIPVGEEGRSFLDDDGHPTGQDEGRVCDINTTRVRVPLWYGIFSGTIICQRKGRTNLTVHDTSGGCTPGRPFRL